MAERPMKVLALASYFKGERFLVQAHRRGAQVYLFTQAKLLDRPWPRQALVDVFAQPDGSPLHHTLHAIAYLARSRVFDRVVALDDYDVETAAAACASTCACQAWGTPPRATSGTSWPCAPAPARRACPCRPSCGVLNYDELRDFMASVPPPWMLKPRSEASASGIVKVQSPEQLWRTLDALGDRQSYFLLEKYLPGDVYHVDSIVQDRRGAVLPRCTTAARRRSTWPMEAASTPRTPCSGEAWWTKG